MTAITLGVILLCFIGTTSLSVYAGMLLLNTDFKVAPGKINSVNNCEQQCPVVAGFGCIRIPHVSIQWTIDETVFVATNITAVAACDDCCQSMVGKDVDVRIDPQNASVALAVLSKGSQNPSLFYTVCFLILCVAFSFIFFGCLVMVVFQMKRQRGYVQTD